MPNSIKQMLRFAALLLTASVATSFAAGASEANTALAIATTKKRSYKDKSRPTASAQNAGPSKALLAICWKGNYYTGLRHVELSDTIETFKRRAFEFYPRVPGTVKVMRTMYDFSSGQNIDTFSSITALPCCTNTPKTYALFVEPAATTVTAATATTSAQSTAIVESSTSAAVSAAAHHTTSAGIAAADTKHLDTVQREAELRTATTGTHTKTTPKDAHVATAIKYASGEDANDPAVIAAAAVAIRAPAPITAPSGTSASLTTVAVIIGPVDSTATQK